mgnify:CR=1 FL=1
MPLFYKAVQSPIANKAGAKLWHLNLVKAGGTVATQQLAEVIAEKSSLTAGDVQNVVRNLMSVMREYLLNSRSVRLDGLGTFTMKACTRGKGVESADKVSPNQITALKCRFTPEYTRSAALGTTRALWQGVEFEKWTGVNGSAGDGEDPDDNGGGNSGGDGGLDENPLG